MKLRQTGGSISAPLPREMAERLHLSAGDTALAIETDRGLLIKPCDYVTEEAPALAAEFSTDYRNTLRDRAFEKECVKKPALLDIAVDPPQKIKA